MTERLEIMTKGELISLSKKLKISGASKLRKEDLIKRIISEKSTKEILKIVAPTLWQRKRTTISIWASIIGVILTAYGVIPNTRSIQEDKQTSYQVYQNETDSIQFNNLIFSSAQELRKNKEYIFDLNWHFKNSNYYKPIGGLNFEETKKLLNSHFSKLLKYTFGEEKYLLQLVLKLEDSSNKLSNIKNSYSYQQFNETYDMTFDDITFLNGFLFWYFSYVSENELSVKLHNTLGWNKNEDDFRERIDTMNLLMRYLDYPDFGYVTSYEDYLGLID